MAKLPKLGLFVRSAQGWIISGCFLVLVTIYVQQVLVSNKERKCKTEVEVSQVPALLASRFSSSLVSKEPLIPLETVYEAARRRKLTIFLLRFKKTGSTILGAFFSEHVNQTDCKPHMTRLSRINITPEPQCSRLHWLLKEATFKEGCKNMTGWDEPQWQPGVLPCLYEVGPLSYEESFHRLKLKEHRVRVRETFAGAKVISGHYAYGLHWIGHRGEFAYVTSIRHPVARLVSWWNYLMIQVQHRENPVFTFEGFYMSDPIDDRHSKSNHMVRALCNEDTGLAYDPEFPDSRSLPLDDVLNEVTEKHYQCAVSHLHRDFALVFQYERVREVFPLTPTIAKVFNRAGAREKDVKVDYKSNPIREDWKMVTVDSISPEVKQRLDALNKWDLLLYAEAERLHDLSIARLEEMKDKLNLD